MPELDGYVKPSLSYHTSDAYETVKLRTDSSPEGSLPAISIPVQFNKTVDQFPENQAICFKDESNVWRTLNYREYQQKVKHVAKAFIKLGLQSRDAVAVISFNCPEWFYSELAAIYAGGIATGVYTTNSADAVHHILSTSQTKILVVDDSKQMKKIREIWSKLPDLKSVIQINGPFESEIGAEDGYYKWSDIEEMNTEDLDGELEHRLNNISVNECCVLIYTSGTVGFPKAVMLSHDNITWNLQAIGERYGNIIRGRESTISYLPMSHIAAQIVDIFLPIYMAGSVHFADRDALKGTLIKTLSRVHPTRFMGVPRVFEKFYEQLIGMEPQLNPLKKALLNWARSTALNHHLDVMDGKSSDTWQFKLAKHLVLNKIKRSLGLDESRVTLVGGAPVSIEIKNFFLSIDVPLTEVYGMSESSGAHCMCNRNVPNQQTVGKPLQGIPTKIANPDSSGVGEICMKARTVFMGYLNDPEKTKECIDEDEWLHTGDLGTIDDKGYVYVTGRLKEIIITAGGENVPPVHIEELIKTELPVLSNVFLVGDKRKFLTVLLSFRTEVDTETGVPKDNLVSEVIEWLEGLNLQYTKWSEILNAGPCPVVLKGIQDGIDRANKNAISNAQKVQKFALLPEDFSVATGELGPTLKLKRTFVCKKYVELIEGLYKS